MELWHQYPTPWARGHQPPPSLLFGAAEHHEHQLLGVRRQFGVPIPPGCIREAILARSLYECELGLVSCHKAISKSLSRSPWRISSVQALPDRMRFSSCHTE